MNDGISDATEVIQNLLDRGGKIEIPQGNYRITKTLRVFSDTTMLSNGQTNDDMIAFNADDSLERVENVGMVRGDIEDITVDGNSYMLADKKNVLTVTNFSDSQESLSY